MKIFHEIANNPNAYAKKIKNETGRSIIGHFCTYTPEEIIHASGALPFRIFGTKENITLADKHLQSYCCSLVRGGLEDALSGNLSFLDGTVFPHTCDSIQRLSDIWRLNAGFPLHLDVILPVKLNTESARTYMIEVLHKFRTDLEKVTGKEISDKKISESVKLYNSIRQSLADIYRIRSKYPDLISGNDIYAIMKSSTVMDREEFLKKLLEIVNSLSDKTGKKDKSAKRLVLAGNVCNHPDIYSMIENAGAYVVWDDLCTGSRYFGGQIDEGGDPVTKIADRYFDRLVCPAKHRDVTSRGKNLVEIVKDHNAQGVIFILLKFCDPHSFDYPYMKELLDNESIPGMLLEFEEQPPPEGQLKTRFETFIEML